MIPQEVLESRQFYLDQLPPISEENQRHLERYKKFILSRPERDLEKEKEYNIHHIFPKSMSNEESNRNLIKLTVREHFIAHLILWKCGYSQMIHAFWFMTNKKLSSISSKQFQVLREQHNNIMSSRMSGENHPFYGLDRSDETKQKISRSHIGKIAPMKGKHFSSEKYELFYGEKFRKRISEIHRGSKRTEETKQKMRENHFDCSGKNNPAYGKPGTMFGKHHTEEAKQKIQKHSTGASNPMAKKVRCLETGQTFSWMKEGAEIIYGDKKWASWIKKSIKQNKAIKGFTWKFIEEENNTYGSN